MVQMGVPPPGRGTKPGQRGPEIEYWLDLGVCTDSENGRPATAGPFLAIGTIPETHRWIVPHAATR